MAESNKNVWIEPKSSKEEDTPPPETERANTDYHWITIPPGGLRQIAQEHLGDAERWDEIHEHNRDIMPDPGKHTVGQSVRVPSSLKFGKKEKKA